MLTAELKVNGKVIGTFEARRTLYATSATGLPIYNCTAWVDNPRAAGKLGRTRIVEDHNPATDDAWDLVRKALSWKVDADLATAIRGRDKALAEIDRLRSQLSSGPCLHLHGNDPYTPIEALFLRQWERTEAQRDAALDAIDRVRKLAEEMAAATPGEDLITDGCLPADIEQISGQAILRALDGEAQG